MKILEYVGLILNDLIKRRVGYYIGIRRVSLSEESNSFVAWVLGQSYGKN